MLSRRIRLLTQTVLLTFTAFWPAAAIVISAGSADSLNVSAGGSAFGVNLSGVVEVITDHGLCSGSLLSDGLSILTAGHCVSNAYPSPLFGSAVVNFLGPTGMISAEVGSIAVNPGWTGDLTLGGDLAVLRLSATAPNFATRYSLYDQPIQAAVDLVVAGYGYGGNGTTGADPGYPYGQLRAGTNQYVRSGAYVGWSNTLYLAQFYSGSAITNVLDSIQPYYSATEVDIAPGDSGGPTFRNGQIAGVHDTIACFTNNGQCATAQAANNSSYGQFFADVSTAANSSWIVSQQVTATPEPASVFLALAGLAFIAVRRL